MTTRKAPSGEVKSKPSRAPAPEAPAYPPGSPGAQLHVWNQAMQLFGQRRFAEAAAAFREAAAGPAVHVADKARSYLLICERKASEPRVELHTADEHFNYALERMTARDFEPARVHLARALAMEPDGDHILYVMALCSGLAGDGNGACENLKRAIAIEPRNRMQARQDPEFSALAGRYPNLRALLAANV